jgi:hypothetical protein
VSSAKRSFFIYFYNNKCLIEQKEMQGQRKDAREMKKGQKKCNARSKSKHPSAE